ncbi:MAG: undecaprenyl-diphosphate phosphatase [Planctomycetaceae bacterium]|jgi:undecaprenyl-diphosphatase|nr:undecaprenyl-diphosphate phosphatase [Planctomycetaceae bacterium]
MLELIQIIIIAVVQGIGEFLPISSSGHNAVVDKIFQLSGHPLANSDSEFIKLNVFLHAGTLIAVLIVFRQRIFAMLGRDWRLIPMLLAATVPAVVVGLPIEKLFPWIETNLYIIAGCFILTGILLLTSLRHSGGNKTTSTMTWLDAMFIGCAQAVAVLPGLSRSGTTIVAGLYRKLNREEAAAFSFLLSIPVIAGGTILETKDLLEDSAGEGGVANYLLLIGVAVSCLAGIIALVWLLNWLKNGKLWYFAVWVFLMSPMTYSLTLFPVPEVTITPSGSAAGAAEQAVPNAESALDLPPAKAAEDAETKKEQERVLAEEREKERKLIDEERKLLPVIDNADSLIPLDKDDRIWITPDRKAVVFIGRVAMREGLLELFACRTGTKEHESILSVRVKPYLIHAALLLIEAKQGKAMQTQPVFTPATGDRISITLRWKDTDGGVKEVPAQNWISRAEESESPDAASSVSALHWVFSGSTEYQDDEGRTHYLANESGELIGLSNFPGSVLDVPIQSSNDNTQLMFACFTRHIPPLDTPVTVILKRTDNE